MDSFITIKETLAWVVVSYKKVTLKLPLTPTLMISVATS
jgi:hypothetical protein